MTATIITIGDEILIGQIVDTNSAWMGNLLNLHGISIREIVSISDDETQIKDSLALASKHSDLVLITGGLGPTKDDITKKAMADYFGVGMDFHEPTWERIKKMFAKWGRSTTPAHKEQCFMPSNAKILFNKMGTAPGMLFEENERLFVSMPGVPYEMKYILEHQLLPVLKEKLGKVFLEHRTILTVGEGESRIASRLESIEENLPAHIKLAYLPGLGQVRLRLSGKSTNESLLKSEIEALKKAIVEEISELVYGFDKDNLATEVGGKMTNHGLRLGLAESCTGGYIASQITQNSGASAYFEGGVVVYSNELKERLLDVNTATLESHGAVSEEVVTEMVKGTLNKLSADIALAVSGIAGPTGGTADKPVGTIWLAVGNKDRIVTQRLNLSKDRVQNIKYTGVAALNMIRKFLLEFKFN